MKNKSNLITAAELSGIYLNKDVVCLYTKMNFPVNLSASTNCSDKLLIPGTRYFDFEHEFADQTTHLPHMLPDIRDFAKKLGTLGIDNDTEVVVYDNQEMFSAPRVWWMFKALGHEKVCVLDGGLQAWVNAGHPTAPLQSEVNENKSYLSPEAYLHLVNSQQLLWELNAASARVADARGAGRFLGLEPEPRKGVRGGHIPNSVNLHYAKCTEKGFLKARHTLQDFFSSITPTYQSEKWIFSCGSGVTACILALSAQEVGIQNWAVYDGSWSEWGANQALPIESQTVQKPGT